MLIIEDDEKNLKLFQTIIEALGYSALSERSGKEGIRMAMEEMPNLILMDIHMPGMDGISAMKVLRSDEKMKDIPIIAVTSYAMRGDRQRFIKAGFNGYISKPISKDTFIDTIKFSLKGVGDD